MTYGTLGKHGWAGRAEARGACWKLTVPRKEAWKSALGPSYEELGIDSPDQRLLSGISVLFTVCHVANGVSGKYPPRTLEIICKVCVCLHFLWRVSIAFSKGIKDSTPLVQTLESLPVSTAGEEQGQAWEKEPCHYWRLGRTPAGKGTGCEVLIDNVSNTHHLLSFYSMVDKMLDAWHLFYFIFQQHI